MTKIILSGCCGKMGQMVTSMCAQDESIQIVAGVDPVAKNYQLPYPVFRTIWDCKDFDKDVDVVVDFSDASGTDALLEFCLERQTPLVLCTTGLCDMQTYRVEKLAEEVPVLRSANMTLGINLLMELAKKASPILAEAGFDIEIVEKHHNQKVDAPSGTAVALAAVMNKEMNHVYSYVYDRSKERKKRSHDEIGISSVRGGTIVGDHDVIFAGMDEVVTLSHTAYSRKVFAKGAIEAAKYLVGKPAGHYTMLDVINNNSGKFIGLEITKTLTVSTGHVTKDTFKRLLNDGMLNEIGLPVYKKATDGDMFGLFVYIEPNCLDYNKIPEDLAVLVKLAQDEGCGILCLDNDGPELENITTYEW